VNQNESLPGCAGCAGLDRRGFLVRSAYFAAAAALAACGGADTTAPTISAGTTIKVTDYPTLANAGGVAMVTVGGAALAIVRADANNFVALSRVCPHQGSIVNQNGTAGFLCPNHGARFDQTGKWIGGERTGNLHAYATSYNAATGVLTLS
jgi:Rieske Fe-S protein